MQMEGKLDIFNWSQFDKNEPATPAPVVTGDINTQKRSFVRRIRKLTGLSYPDIAGLTRAYKVDAFFEKYINPIVERQLGEEIAMRFLSLTRLPVINPNDVESFGVNMGDKLTKTLALWIQPYGRPIM